ncbi:SMI1/KNR4 family protein [Blastopirellula sp. JC732]|uniref:SMI1/KNR4 family protein n=1 Tax=Blastopirellula sediminis TaxID=2894196 RepID=A0A9X1SEX8_9BACT|nr:SMI1/KNR4 family protein [Blastopirellula sediminis]MCC9607985.1 SMI1/KNR4 family protein [Blastopirellula sediminis]MCC9627222.1 SMI1/KNR4 family protein [Blastopirellula sediminis]
MRREGMTERFLACWFNTYPPAPEEEITKLLATRPWLPHDYLEFLRMTDGAVLEMFVFYGLANGHVFPIARSEFYVKPYGSDDWVAVGQLPSGDAFVIHRSGSIATIGSDPLPDEPVPLCDSFQTLIEDICCGEWYTEFFGGPPVESEWLDHIRAKGWSR